MHGVGFEKCATQTLLGTKIIHTIIENIFGAAYGQTVVRAASFICQNSTKKIACNVDQVALPLPPSLGWG